MTPVLFWWKYPWIISLVFSRGICNELNPLPDVPRFIGFDTYACPQGSSLWLYYCSTSCYYDTNSARFVFWHGSPVTTSMASWLVHLNRKQKMNKTYIFPDQEQMLKNVNYCKSNWDSSNQSSNRWGGEAINCFLKLEHLKCYKYSKRVQCFLFQGK